MAVDEEQRQPRISEAPSPGGLAVDPPAGLVPLDHGGLTEQLLELIDDRGEELTTPAEVTEQPGSADGQSEEVVEQVPGLAQGDAEVGPAVAGEQAGARADVGAGQFQVAAALAGPLTGTPLSISLGATYGLFPRSRVGTSVRDARRRLAALRRRLDGTTRSVL
jgi:hypothetical protein